MRGIRRFFLLLVTSLLVVFGPAAAENTAEPTIPSRLAPSFIEFFDTLALTADFGPFNRRPAWVRKWNGPVTITLSEPAEKLRDDIERLTRRVSRWTGLPFSVATPGTRPIADGSNVINIRLIPQADTGAAFASGDIVCQTETHGMGGALHTGYMVISERYIDCLTHEFMHVLGFDSHWRPTGRTNIRSVLALRDTEMRTSDFSSWDILAIRLLYNQRIHAGMPRGRSLVIANEVIRRGPQRAALPSASGFRQTNW